MVTPESHEGPFPSPLFLFGLAGVGKSYVAGLLARRAGYYVYEGDTDLPPAMQGAIARKEPFTDEMRDALCARLIERISELRRDHPRLVITQALYRSQHRQRVQEAVPALTFLWVRASDETIVRRLTERGDAVTPAYAAAMRKNFESPGSQTPSVLNEGSEAEVWEALRQALRVSDVGGR